MKKCLRYTLSALGILILIDAYYPGLAEAQSHNYWSRNFNEESSLLSGAVVGGGAGPAAIFYNPASIAEIQESKISLNASLFAFEYLNSSNAWGENMDLYYPRGVIVPRFISYMLKSKKRPNLSLEIAFLNNEDSQVEDSKSIDQNIEVLDDMPGTERYNTYYEFKNKYRDDWVGIGGSVHLKQSIYLGTSMFTSVRSLDYSYTVDIEAGPDEANPVPTDSKYSGFTEHEYLAFNDFRLLFKFGVLYKKDRLSIGLNFTTPSIGNIFSNQKKITHKLSYNNITDPSDGSAIGDVLISDYREYSEVTVNARSPFSLAAGVTWSDKKNTKTFYLTGEYYTGIDAYKYAQATEGDNIATGAVPTSVDLNDWLTFVSGAKPVLNGAVGVRWLLKENLTLLSGIRSDFSYRKGFDYGSLSDFNTVINLDMDKYHLTGGLKLRIKGLDLIMGVQYTRGSEKDQEQLTNFSDPKEFNPADLRMLQGNKEASMVTTFNAFIIYFGTTINFYNKTAD